MKTNDSTRSVAFMAMNDAMASLGELSVLTYAPSPGMMTNRGLMANTRRPYSLAIPISSGSVHRSDITSSMNRMPTAAIATDTVRDISMDFVNIPRTSSVLPLPTFTAITVAPPMLMSAFRAARSWMIGIITLTAPSAVGPMTFPTTMLPSMVPNETAMVDITVAAR